MIARPREVKEIPCEDCVPIIIDSTIGGLTNLSDFHSTMKLAPEPPAVSFSATTYRIDSKGFRVTGLSKYFFKNLGHKSCGFNIPGCVLKRLFNHSTKAWTYGNHTG